MKIMKDLSKELVKNDYVVLIDKDSNKEIAKLIYDGSRLGKSLDKGEKENKYIIHEQIELLNKDCLVTAIIKDSSIKGYEYVDQMFYEELVIYI